MKNQRIRKLLLLTALIPLLGMPAQRLRGFELELEGSLSLELTSGDADSSDANWRLEGSAARWRVEGGDWLESGDRLTGLSQGVHRVEFLEIAGWNEPSPVDVFVSGDGTNEAIAEYLIQPTYTAGEIPPQIVLHGNRAAFRVEASSGAPVTLTIGEPAPAGDLSFDGTFFRYEPNLDDRQDFRVLFTEDGAGDVDVEQEVLVSPQPRITEEAEFLEYRFPVPDADSSAYTAVTTKNIPAIHPPFNEEDRLTQLREVTISGKEIVFRPGHPSNLYERFSWTNAQPVKDIVKMSIYAETLIIAAPVLFPQCELTIFAREIRFEDPGDSIGSLSINPLAGTDTRLGSMTVYARKVTAEGERARLFSSPPNAAVTAALNHIVNTRSCIGPYEKTTDSGAEGLGAEPQVTRVAVPARLRPAISSRLEVDYSGDVRKTIFVPVCSELADARDDARAIDVTVPGNIASNLNLDVWTELRASAQRTLYSAVLKVRYDVNVLPSPVGFDLVTYSKLGEDNWDDSQATTLSATGQGTFETLDAPLAWAHPFLIQAAIAHARDAYLVGNPETAVAVIDRYLPLLNEMLGDDESPRAAPAPLVEFAGDLETLRAELDALKQRLDAGLDYFGNPPGWVPMLSFEVNIEAFRNEIDSAVRTLFLTTWLSQKGENISDQVEAMTSVRAQTVEELADMQAEHDEKKSELPRLQNSLHRVEDELDHLQHRLAILEADLAAEAQENVEKKNELPWYKRALRGAGAIAKMVPVPGVKTILAKTVGAGLDTLSRIGEGGGGPSSFGEFVENGVDGAVNKFSSYVDALDPDVNVGGEASENWGQDVTNDAQEVLRCQLKPVKDLRSAITNKYASPDEVAAELDRLRASNARFQRVASDLKAAVTRRGTLVFELNETVQRLAELSVSIVQAIQAIVNLNENLESNLTVLDHRTLKSLKDIERQVKDRLLWYQYLTAKAFQYRLVRPYDDVAGANFLLANLFDEFVELGQFDQQDGHVLSSLQLEGMVSIYEQELNKITSQILDDLNGNAQERQDSFTFGLSAEELEILNTEGELELNLVERGLFFPDRENLRLVNIETEILDVTPIGGSYGEVALLSMGFRHGGLSTLRRAGESFAFNHLRGESSTPPSWDTSFDGIVDQVSETTLSSASQSLLASLLEIDPSEGTLLYLRPAANATLVIDKQVILRGGDVTDMNVDRLQVRVTYDFYRKPTSQVDLNVEVADGYLPTILLDREDVNGRQDGHGTFSRVFSAGEIVRLDAPLTYGLLAFERWVDENGNLISEEPSLEVVLDDYTTLRAEYSEAPAISTGPQFRRGDANSSGKVDLSDGVFVLNYLFLGGESPTCLDAADSDDSGNVDISDGIYVLNYLFLGGAAPAAPGAESCGADVGDDGLGTCAYNACGL